MFKGFLKKENPTNCKRTEVIEGIKKLREVLKLRKILLNQLGSEIWYINVKGNSKTFLFV